MADLKHIYKLFDEAGFLDKALLEIKNKDIPFIAKRDGKRSVTYRNAVDTFNAGLAVRDAVRKGKDSKMPVRGLNMLGKVIAKQVSMDPRFSPEVRGTGTINNPGIKASMPAGGGRVGLVVDPKDFNDTSGFYTDKNTTIDVNRNRISARRDLGKVGPFNMSVQGDLGRRDYGVKIGGGMKFAKGGTVKAYSNSPRKPKKR